ncbi:hypothetical protein HKB24_08675 [Vibrio parahaemolyticus]|nr:hypothetical protein [Vibrio parahaemolyticus]NMS53289.1 hypothetical protein [Vibrio parahaemolyticus]
MNSKQDIITGFHNALFPFDLNIPFANGDDGSPQTLGESIRFWSRPQGSRSSCKRHKRVTYWLDDLSIGQNREISFLVLGISEFS